MKKQSNTAGITELTYRVKALDSNADKRINRLSGHIDHRFNLLQYDFTSVERKIERLESHIDHKFTMLKIDPPGEDRIIDRLKSHIDHKFEMAEIARNGPAPTSLFLSRVAVLTLLGINTLILLKVLTMLGG